MWLVFRVAFFYFLVGAGHLVMCLEVQKYKEMDEKK